MVIPPEAFKLPMELLEPEEPTTNADDTPGMMLAAKFAMPVYKLRSASYAVLPTVAAPAKLVMVMLPPVPA